MWWVAMEILGKVCMGLSSLIPTQPGRAQPALDLTSMWGGLHPHSCGQQGQRAENWLP